MTKRKKCIHIYGAPLFAVELCRLTIPRILSYANRIQADVRLIGGVRRFASYPLTFERFQIYENGWEYEWNACIDADILLGEDTPDFSQLVKRDSVGVVMSYPASNFFSLDHRFFARSGSNLAPVQSFVVSSDWTHDVWEPLKGSADRNLAMVVNPEQIAEYALAYNIAKYRLPCAGIFPAGTRISRVCGDPQAGITAVHQALVKISEWEQR